MRFRGPEALSDTYEESDQDSCPEGPDAVGEEGSLFPSCEALSLTANEHPLIPGFQLSEGTRENRRILPHENSSMTERIIS